MKRLGIVGGIGPESTIEYYRQVIAGYRERVADGGYPPLVINSIDMQAMLEHIRAGRLAEVADYLLGELRRLERAGADFALLASNTPHIVFGELERRSPLPLLSIVRAARDAAAALGLGRVGLLGTRFTMGGGFYAEEFARAGVEVFTPDEADQAYVHEKYMGELVHGVFLPETREGLLAVVDRLSERAGVEGVVLGGTELPLILPDAAGRALPFLDTTRIHAARAVEEMLAGAGDAP
ncbi:MAG TPA: amino acid racemase [Pyrinomonadaceae bacterium]|jgi:aspartate racemase